MGIILHHHDNISGEMENGDGGIDVVFVVFVIFVKPHRQQCHCWGEAGRGGNDDDYNDDCGGKGREVTFLSCHQALQEKMQGKRVLGRGE